VAFVVDMTKLSDEQGQQLMDAMNDAINDDITSLMKEKNISWECAADVSYLRTRSRWKQEHEDELIRLHSIGEPPRMCDWP